jgi:predicted outer membrane repeat protein
VTSTIIDGWGKGSVVTFENGEDANCVLNGFTITNGYAHGHWPACNGGGLITHLSCPTIVSCIFVDNGAEDSGGAIYSYESNLTLINCRFQGNHAGDSGGGILTTGALVYQGVPIRIDNCAFIDNSAEDDGGGAYLDGGGLAKLTNCLFSRNCAGNGGGIGINAGSTEVVNCTFVENLSNGNSGAVDLYEAQLSLKNCILWNVESREVHSSDSWTNITYCDIQGAWPGEGNVDADPCFADSNNGDFHLKSQAGRWDANEQQWTTDEVTSPCIDAGDPMTAIGHEPFPNGGRINMGAYGGTAEASKSYFGKPPCETIVAGDINGDCEVNFKDFAIMGLHWLDIPDPDY